MRGLEPLPPPGQSWYQACMGLLRILAMAWIFFFLIRMGRGLGARSNFRGTDPRSWRSPQNNPFDAYGPFGPFGPFGPQNQGQQQQQPYTNPFAQQQHQAPPPPRPSVRQKTPFEVLGIHPGSNKQEIRQAYQELVRQYHPDRVADLGVELRELAERKTKELNAAYNQLKRNL